MEYFDPQNTFCYWSAIYKTGSWQQPLKISTVAFSGGLKVTEVSCANKKFTQVYCS